MNRREFLKIMGIVGGIAIAGNGLEGIITNLHAQTNSPLVYESEQTKKTETKLESLYNSIAKDANEGKPLIVTNYLGLWVDEKPPETNLYWGAFYGHFRMLERANRDNDISKNFTCHDWKRIYLQKSETDPIITAVYETRVINDFWKKLGVKKPLKILQVYKVFKNLENAGSGLGAHLKNDEAEVLQTNNGLVDLKDSRILGYVGHNFMMDNPEFSGFKTKKTANKTKGVFAIACVTKDYFEKDLVSDDVVGLLFTKSLMAPEGYTSMALTDGIARGLSAEDIVKNCNNKYSYFQKLGKQKVPPSGVFAGE